MRNGSIIFALLIMLMVISCGKFRKLEKSEDWRVKFEGGLGYYAKKDYYRAAILFESILPIVRGLPEGEKVQFYLAYCQYHDRLYLLASEQFRTFFETYGRSVFAEEARYMYAYSLFQSSPDPNLDQTSSIDAMQAMQEFINRYPASKFRDQAIDVINSSQRKLEKKGFENAYQYYRMRYYKAAVVSLTNFTQNFPDSKYLEQAYYLMIDAEYRLAEKSVSFKQNERYQAVVTRYTEYVDRYPDSEYLKDAEKLYAASLEQLKKGKNSNL